MHMHMRTRTSGDACNYRYTHASAIPPCNPLCSTASVRSRMPHKQHCTRHSPSGRMVRCTAARHWQRPARARAGSAGGVGVRRGQRHTLRRCQPPRAPCRAPQHSHMHRSHPAGAARRRATAAAASRCAQLCPAHCINHDRPHSAHQTHAHAHTRTHSWAAAALCRAHDQDIDEGARHPQRPTAYLRSSGKLNHAARFLRVRDTAHTLSRRLLL
jgi:hypothetical protein